MIRTKLVEAAGKEYSSEEMKTFVDSLTHVEMAYLWRFSPIGHTFWLNNDYAMKRFYSFGGMTPQVSKQIGWDEE
jgi:hypothetical protein